MADVKTKEVVKRGNPFKKVWKKICRFFKELTLELKKVTWPNKKQVVDNTSSVLLFCVLVGAIIWASDFLLETLIKLVYNLI